MKIRKAVIEQVRERANNCCEYCRVSRFVELVPSQIDHVAPICHGGGSTFDNLALACLLCNRFKGSHVAGIDPETKRVIRLFHPRRDRWHEHFEWKGARIVGRTSIGRTTCAVLRLNLEFRVSYRRILIRYGRLDRIN
jgi:hypothetical protein